MKLGKWSGVVNMAYVKEHLKDDQLKGFFINIGTRPNQKDKGSDKWVPLGDYMNIQAFISVQNDAAFGAISRMIEKARSQGRKSLPIYFDGGLLYSEPFENRKTGQKVNSLKVRILRDTRISDEPLGDNARGAPLAGDAVEPQEDPPF